MNEKSNVMHEWSIFRAQAGLDTRILIVRGIRSKASHWRDFHKTLY